MSSTSNFFNIADLKTGIEMANDAKNLLGTDNIDLGLSRAVLATIHIANTLNSISAIDQGDRYCILKPEKYSSEEQTESSTNIVQAGSSSQTPSTSTNIVPVGSSRPIQGPSQYPTSTYSIPSTVQSAYMTGRVPRPLTTTTTEVNTLLRQTAKAQQPTNNSLAIVPSSSNPKPKQDGGRRTHRYKQKRHRASTRKQRSWLSLKNQTL